MSTTVVTEAEPVHLEQGTKSTFEVEDAHATRLNEVAAEAPLTFDTKLRLIVAGYSFFCAGVNDGSLGPIIPYLLTTYNINTNFVSIV